MIRMNSLLFAFGLAVGLAVSPPSARAVAVGEVAPDFRVSDSAGQNQSLSQYKGKWVVLEWFNEGCPYVKKHYLSDNMQALQRDSAKRGVVWLSVISSAPGKQGHGTPDQINARRGEWKIASAATLLDPEGKVGRLYEAKTTPHVFVINPEGKIVYMGAIDDKPTSDLADIPASRNLVKAALDAALAGKPVAVGATVPYGCSVKY